MTKHVHLAVYDTMSDWEVGHATAHINNDDWQRDPGRYRVVTVGESREPVRTMGGMTITPDIALDELGADGSAMLILPGADTWLSGGNTAFARKAGEFLDVGVPVAAICGATAGLAAEGLLDDRRHTSNAPEVVSAFGSKGGEHYCDLPAVTDRGLTTASGIAPVDFAREVFAALELYTPDVLESWYKLYGLGDPAGYFELEGASA
ncbi:DJ-1/PfpI family protein [Glycomyces salinus]|uniref:DJ-1/PfpI family protein n=1 Tax=Glycomyces salinus TaxID=980294 RepID=UPI0018EE295F|nr:DJ-1/PfpI family protein [Glycomyces salinus]